MFALRCFVLFCCIVSLCVALLCCALLCFAFPLFFIFSAYALPTLCYAVLCYAMLCYAMLCYAMLCYAMLCYAMLCYGTLCSVSVCSALLCSALLSSAFFLFFSALLCYLICTCCGLPCIYFALRCFALPHTLAPRHEAGHCLFFRFGALFPELVFVDHEVAVSTPTHARTGAHLCRRNKPVLDEVFSGPRHRSSLHLYKVYIDSTRNTILCPFRTPNIFPVLDGDQGRPYEEHQRQPSTHKIGNTTQDVHEYIYEIPHITRSTAVYRTAGFWPLQN